MTVDNTIIMKRNESQNMTIAMHTKNYLRKLFTEHYIQPCIKSIFTHNLSITRSQHHPTRAEFSTNIIRYAETDIEY